MRKSFKILATSIVSIALMITCSFTVLAEETYTDSDTGITFKIPDGWSAVGLSKDDRQVAKEKFSTGDSGEVFVYLSANLYEQLPDEYKEQYSEDIFKGYRLSESDVKEMLDDSNGSYTSYSTETIGGIEWYVLKNSLMDYYVQYINGNMVGFTISTLMDSDEMAQVKDVIEEVSIAESAKENTSETITSSSTSTVSQNSSVQSNYKSSSYNETSDGAKIMAFVMLIIIGIGIAIWRNKKSVSKKEEQLVICKNCGTNNSKDNKFCTKCGSKID